MQQIAHFIWVIILCPSLLHYTCPSYWLKMPVRGLCVYILMYWLWCSWIHALAVYERLQAVPITICSQKCVNNITLSKTTRESSAATRDISLVVGGFSRVLTMFIKHAIYNYNIYTSNYIYELYLHAVWKTPSIAITGYSPQKVCKLLENY